MPVGEKWNNENNRHFADEYDSYLLYAAGQLRRGATDTEVVAYLVQIESEHMGLGERPDSRKRAQAVVTAIHADDQLWTYPDDRARCQSKTVSTANQAAR